MLPVARPSAGGVQLFKPSKVFASVHKCDLKKNRCFSPHAALSTISGCRVKKRGRHTWRAVRLEGIQNPKALTARTLGAVESLLGSARRASRLHTPCAKDETPPRLFYGASNRPPGFSVTPKSGIFRHEQRREQLLMWNKNAHVHARSKEANAPRFCAPRRQKPNDFAMFTPRTPRTL